MRAKLIVLALASVLVGTTVYAATPASAATTLNAANFRFTKTGYSSVIAQLDAALPNVTVANVLANTNRTASRCTPSASNLVIAFCWNAEDNASTTWYPQGVTTTADASATGTYEGSTAVLTTWYDHTDAATRGVRVSFVDWANTSAPKYRHAMLVEPYTNAAGKPDFRAVKVHAGGVVWYGPYLYVVDTSRGFRVFDMRHIWQVTANGGAGIGLQPDGTYQASDYLYVIPEAFKYNDAVTGGYPKLRYSFVGLDRTSSPDSLIVGEYASPGAGTRLARFPLNESDNLLAPSADGFVKGTEAYQVDVQSMQGALAINGKFYLSTSDGSGNKGDLATFTPGGPIVMRTDHLPIGPEDFAYWGGRDQLWSLAEYPGGRSVFAIRASAY